MSVKIPNLTAIRDWCIGKFQPKGDYLTSIPREYVTESEMMAYSQPIGDYASRIVLQDYCLIDDAGNTLALNIDPIAGLMTIALKNARGRTLSEKTANLILESVVVGVSYNSGLITFTLQNGTTLEANITDIVRGLVNSNFTIAGIDMEDDITAEELKAALSLDKVENVPVNEQEPTFTQATSRSNIESGENLSTIFGKIKKVFADLHKIAFSGDYDDLSNKPEIPPAVSVKGNAEALYRTGEVNITPENIGLDKVENKSVTEILDELTYDNVTTALGFVPANKDTPILDMEGATEYNAGVRGLVPAPSAGPRDRYLGSDGDWHEFTGAKVTVDSELNDTSENPVENKAVTIAINNIWEQDGSLDDTD